MRLETLILCLILYHEIKTINIYASNFNTRIYFEILLSCVSIVLFTKTLCFHCLRQFFFAEIIDIPFIFWRAAGVISIFIAREKRGTEKGRVFFL